MKKINHIIKKSHICKRKFSIDHDDNKYYKVRDHYHFTGKNRGAAHNI